MLLAGVRVATVLGELTLALLTCTCFSESKKAEEFSPGSCCLLIRASQTRGPASATHSTTMAGLLLTLSNASCTNVTCELICWPKMLATGPS
jgi:hypothetical protein